MFECKWMDPDGIQNLLLTREGIARLMWAWRMESCGGQLFVSTALDEQQSVLFVGREVE